MKSYNFFQILVRNGGLRRANPLHAVGYRFKAPDTILLILNAEIDEKKISLAKQSVKKMMCLYPVIFYQIFIFPI